MQERFYVTKNNVGCFFVCDSQSALQVLPGQRYGYTKQYAAQKVADDLNAGRETPESMRTLWCAGERIK